MGFCHSLCFIEAYSRACHVFDFGVSLLPFEAETWYFQVSLMTCVKDSWVGSLCGFTEVMLKWDSSCLAPLLLLWCCRQRNTGSPDPQGYCVLHSRRPVAQYLIQKGCLGQGSYITLIPKTCPSYPITCKERRSPDVWVPPLVSMPKADMSDKGCLWGGCPRRACYSSWSTWGGGLGSLRMRETTGFPFSYSYLEVLHKNL